MPFVHAMLGAVTMVRTRRLGHLELWQLLFLDNGNSPYAGSGTVNSNGWARRPLSRVALEPRPSLRLRAGHVDLT